MGENRRDESPPNLLPAARLNPSQKATIMSSPSRSPKRQTLCSRANADRVAYQLCDTTEESIAVVRTGDDLQPYRVVPVNRAEERFTELEVHVI